MDSSSDAPAQPKSRVSCPSCGVTFTRADNLKAHEKKFHQRHATTTALSLACPLCEERGRTIHDLHGHIEREHPGVALDFRHEIFYREADFQAWKARLERETAAFFAKAYSSSGGGLVTRQYRCHRSGAGRGAAGGDRKRRGRGSGKTGVTCPAVMKVVADGTDWVVSCQLTHLGHECEATRLRMKKEERQEVASMLAAGTPIGEVVQRARSRFPGGRASLLTRRDVYNIGARLLNLNPGVREDLAAVDAAVTRMMQEEDNPVLLYKPAGLKLDHYPLVEEGEFLLGISTQSQLQALNSHGRYCVVLDSLHDAGKHRYLLTTVFVRDHSDAGVPVAVLFSTRRAAETWRPFFDAIKLRIPDFQTRILVTADTDTFLEAWRGAFGQAPFHLLAPWHVVQDLEASLRATGGGEEGMGRRLRQMVHEPDYAAFKSCLASFTEEYSRDPFVGHFVARYAPREEMWATCCHLDVGVDTANMGIEQWRRDIKYREGGGPVLNRMEKSLDVVLKAMRVKWPPAKPSPDVYFPGEADSSVLVEVEVSHQDEGGNKAKKRKKRPGDGPKEECLQLIRDVSERVELEESNDVFQYVNDNLKNILTYLDIVKKCEL